MSAQSKVQVIIGSVRAGRLCPRIADWVTEIARARSSGLATEIVDLADFPLPMHDEPGIPALGHYAQPHTQAWSAKVAQAQGFVFVTPQYNWGYPASLKNALDHLHREWRGKAAVVVSYGGHGGGKCAVQLRQVLEGGLKMRVATTMPALELSEQAVRHGELDPQSAFGGHVEAVAQAFGELAELLAADPAAA